MRISALDHGIIYLPQGMETQAVEASKTCVSGWHAFSWYRDPTSESFHQGIGSLQLSLPTTTGSGITPAWIRLKAASKDAISPSRSSLFFTLSPSSPLPYTASASSRALQFQCSWRKCSPGWLHSYPCPAPSRSLPSDSRDTALPPGPRELPLGQTGILLPLLTSLRL